MKKIFLLITTAIILMVSCSKTKTINSANEVKKEGHIVKVIMNTEATAAEWQQALQERFHGNAPAKYHMDFTALRGRKALKAKIKLGAAPLVDTCCTFGAIGSVIDDTVIHQEYTQRLPLQDGEYFGWIDVIMFPPNNAEPVIIGMAYVGGGNWLNDPIVFDYAPNMGVGQYVVRLTGDALPTYRPLTSNDIGAQVN